MTGGRLKPNKVWLTLHLLVHMYTVIYTYIFLNTREYLNITIVGLVNMDVMLYIYGVSLHHSDFLVELVLFI